MMLACETCGAVYSIRDDADLTRRLIVQHPHWSKSTRRCVQCEGTVNIIAADFKDDLQKATELGILHKYTFTAEEAFRAFCGLGTPEEVGHEPEAIEAFLLSSPIVAVSHATSPTGRMIIRALHLANGLVIHLTSSPFGGSVLKVTRTRRSGNGPVDDVQLDLFPETEDDSV